MRILMVLRVSMLLIAAGLLLLPPGLLARPVAGGAGFARYFRGTDGHSDIAAARVEWPSTETTIEFWARVDDTGAKQTLFSYQAVDDGAPVSDNYSNALELTIHPDYIFVSHTSTPILTVFGCQRRGLPGRPDLGNPACSSYSFAHWTHVALSVSAVEGNIKLYLNGTMAFDLLNDNRTVAADQDTASLKVPLPTNLGVIVLGQNPVEYLSTYLYHEQTNALLDQVRMWATDRPEQKIRDWMHVAHLPAEERAGLVIDWQMDSLLEAGQVREADLSGLHNDLYLGEIPQAPQTIQYTDGYPKAAPTVPRVVVSTADVWGGPLGAVVTEHGLTHVALRAKDDSGRPLTVSITRLPIYGRLLQVTDIDGPSPEVSLFGALPSMAVAYVPDDFGNFSTDSFEYTVENDLGETAAAEAVLIRDDATFSEEIVSTKAQAQEGGIHMIRLGGFRRDGEQATVHVTQLPALGKLFQVVHVDEGLVWTTSVITEPILEVPQAVTARSGFVGYVSPGQDQMTGTGVAADVFSCEWTDVQGGNAKPDVIDIEVEVAPVNDRPIASSTEVVVEAGVTSAIELPATDPEGDSIYIELTDMPKLGTVARSDGVRLDPADHPLVSQYAEFIPEYSDEWGPSWSYQYTVCPCCSQQKTCNFSGGAGTRESCGCPYDMYTIEKVLGAPDAFPAAGLSGFAMGIIQTIPGVRNFVTIGISRPVYISAVKMYETLLPGKIGAIRAAATYEGNRTQWDTLYEGPAEDLPADTVQMFSPSLCPAVSQAYQYLRVEFALELGSVYQLDAIEVLGTLQPPSRLLLTDQTALYTPDPGIHGQVETLRFSSRDCLSSANGGEVLVINVDEPLDMAAASTYGEDIELWAVRGEDTLLDLSAVSTLGALLGDRIPLGSVPSLELVATEPMAATLRVNSGGGEWSGSLQPGQPARLPLDDQSVVVSDLQGGTGSYEPFRLQLWLSFNGTVTFRLGLSVRWMCPVGSSPADCALGAEDCSDLEGSWVHSEEDLRCRKSRLALLLSVVLAALGVLTVAVVVGAYLLRRTQRRAKVLAEELEHLTVAGNNYLATIDAESPLSMVVAFLKEVTEPPGAQQKPSQQQEGIKGTSVLWPWRRGEPNSYRSRCEEFAKSAKHLMGVLSSAKDIYTPTFGVQAEGAPEDVQITLNENANHLAQMLTRDTSLALSGRRSSGASSRGTILSGLGVDLSGIDVDHSEAIQAVEAICEKEERLRPIGKTLFFDTCGLVPVSSGKVLTVVTVKAVQALGLADLLSETAAQRFIAYLVEIERRYLDVPYHCSVHGADVTARLTAILRFSGIAKHSNQDDDAILMFSAVLAAAIHDVGHTGTSNAYHVQTQSRVAKRFHDQSVLEANSLSICLELLEVGELDFLMDWPCNQRENLRKTVIKMVLGTDFSQHFEHIGNFKSHIATDNKDPVDFSSLTFNNKLQVLTMALKVADIGHCAAAWELHTKWVDRLQEEGDKEKNRNIPVSALMDREKSGAATPVSQASFAEALALPLFKVWAKAFPGCTPLADQAQDNVRNWKALKSDN